VRVYRFTHTKLVWYGMLSIMEGGYEYGPGYVIEMIKLGLNLVIKLKM
jgi:hypothetical protein